MEFFWISFIMIMLMSIAAQQQRRQAEEEDRNPDLDSLGGDWEYKILRSQKGRFKDPEFLREALAEDAVAGWRLLEKFDDKRLRLKRLVSARERDMALDFDPYRVTIS